MKENKIVLFNNNINVFFFLQANWGQEKYAVALHKNGHNGGNIIKFLFFSLRQKKNVVLFIFVKAAANCKNWAEKMANRLQ